MTVEQVSKMIDHTLLTAYATKKEIKNICNEAKVYGFASVCVNPWYVSYAAKHLKDTDVSVCTVIGFPLGQETSEVKAFAASDAVKNGADEIDMVINIACVKNNDYESVQNDISSVVNASKNAGKEINKNIIVKVILETCYLTDKEIVKCSKCIKAAGADFVKTSTGFATPKGIDGALLPNGASVYHIKLIKDTVGEDMKIKASGGIRTVRMAKNLIEAGADRLGLSSSVSIIQGWDKEN